MASSPDSISMALFCDFENVALGVRDAKYEKFDIKRVLERLLLKGSIVVKKAYCDWERYKSFKAAMHEANFELIEIPHVRQSGKNSADIRLVVDALDLCYTKSHVDTFVIISGDSDFSPLVSKLRENAKQVIGVGVKQSTSDLLIANCDEFIFYDDLVRDSQRAAAKREGRDNPPASRRSPEEDRARREELESRRSKAIDIAVETFDALLAERGESGKIWSSMLKEAIKRRKPDFNESYFGFRAFGNLLEEAQARGLLELGRDEKSGIFVMRPGPGVAAARAREEFAGAGEPPAERTAPAADEAAFGAAAADAAGATPVAAAPPAGAPEARRARGRGRAARQAGETPAEASPAAAGAEAAAQAAAAAVAVAVPEAVPAAAPKAAAAEPEGAAAARPPGTRRRGGSKAETPAPKAQDGNAASSAQPAPRRTRPARAAAAPAPADAAPPPEAGAPVAARTAPSRPAAADSAAAAIPAPVEAAAAPAAEKPASRPRRARKPKAESGG